jgi:hypothetical protein
MRHTDLLRRVPARLLGQARTTAAALDRHGWAEAGAGNLSLRLDAPLLAGPRYRLPMAAPYLCRTALLIKQGGAWMRDIARTPTEGLCLVQIDDRGESCTVRPANARPTSELASHVAAHNRLAACRPQDRAVLHTHPTEWGAGEGRGQKPECRSEKLRARSQGSRGRGQGAERRDGEEAGSR